MSNNTTLKLDLRKDHVCIKKAVLRYRNTPDDGRFSYADASSRVYPFLTNYNPIADIQSGERRNKPHNVLRHMLSQVFDLLGIDHKGSHLVWRQNCGCKCGCSPGFKVIGCTAPKFDIYIEYEYAY